MRFKGFIKKARLLEILLMTGFVLIAIPFVKPLPGDSLVLAKALILLFAANFALLIAVYSANNYFGFKADRINPRFAGNQFESRRHYLAVAAISLVLALVLLEVVNPRLPLLGALSFLLWIWYSAPGGAKSQPVLGTLVHVVGQGIQFHICVLAFSEVTLATILISIYFGLLFASGHLMHEVKDFESDSIAGIRTNAVVFGPENVIRFYRLVVLLIPLYWLGLRLENQVTLLTFTPFFIASIAHAILTFLIQPGTPRFQRYYRALYFVAGVVAIAL